MATKPTVDEIRALIKKLEEFIDKSEVIPATRFYRTVVILGLLSKSLTVGRSICCLVENDFPAEAFGLTRTLIDIYFTVRYISNTDTEARAERYARFFAKNHEDWTKIIAKFYPTRSIPNTLEHQEYLEVAKEYKRPNEWTGLHGQTKEMAREPDTYEFDSDGEPINCEFDYEVIYKWTSHYTHGTILSVESHLPEAEEPFRIRARSRVESGKAASALFNVLAYISKTFVCAYRAMRDDQPDAILTELHQSMRLF
jgi:hypothetical protein